MEIGQLYTAPNHYITCYPSREIAVLSGSDTYGLIQYSDSHLASALDTCRRFFDRHGVKISYIEPKNPFLTITHDNRKYRHDYYEFWQVLTRERSWWIVWHNGPNYNYILPAKSKW